eukprot:478094-Pyramimonas_sp.AAC.1
MSSLRHGPWLTLGSFPPPGRGGDWRVARAGGRGQSACVSRPPLKELRALAAACVRGAPPPAEDVGGAAPAPVRLDRWSPHAFVD